MDALDAYLLAATDGPEDRITAQLAKPEWFHYSDLAPGCFRMLPTNHEFR